MEPLQTRVNIPQSTVQIGYRTKCLLMGSCFSDYIGQIMTGYKFPVQMNPFGTLFNPASIADSIDILIKEKTFTPGELQYHDGLWLSFSHYTGFSHPDKDVCLSHINNSVSQAAVWLKQSRFLILTFGTAWIYRLKDTRKLVANCHKLPSASFSKEFLGPSEIITRYDHLLSLLKKINPDLTLIFTLSPVRHWADGAVNNQLSKSVLHYSIHEILKNHPQACYFPSYEIFMDELRDYRFYASDMLHPSEQATRYIWERFCDSSMDEESRQLLIEVMAISKAAQHRPVNANSEAHRKFQQHMLQKIEQLTREYPYLDFSSEIRLFNA